MRLGLATEPSALEPRFSGSLDRAPSGDEQSLGARTDLSGRRRQAGGPHLPVEHHPSSRPCGFLSPLTGRFRKKTVFLAVLVWPCFFHFTSVVFFHHTTPVTGLSVLL